MASADGQLCWLPIIINQGRRIPSGALISIESLRHQKGEPGHNSSWQQGMEVAASPA